MVQVTRETVQLGPIGHLHKATLSRLGDLADYRIHRKKLRELAKLKGQRNMSKIKE